MRVAAVQMGSGLTPDANIGALDLLVGEAAGAGAVYVQTPEVTVAYARDWAGLDAVAEPWSGNRSVARCADIARRHKVFLHLGSLAIKAGDGRFLNRSVVFSAAGDVMAVYDKIHLFDADLAGAAAYRESATYRAGTKAVLTGVAGFRLGLSICYDVRFPALYRALAEAGANVLAIPAAFTVPTGVAHWDILVRARAIETGSFVIAAAQAGRHENGRVTYGHSMIVDPWGRVLAEAGGEGAGVISAEIDPAVAGAVRSRLPALANRVEFSLSVNDSGAS